MAKREAETVAKTASLITAFAAILLSFSSPDWNSVGIYAGCGIKGRLLYSFFHANLLHATLNTWCLLSVVFLYNISARRLLTSYLVAVLAPVNTFLPWASDLASPTVGLSAVVYFLFGSISFEVTDKRAYQAWMAFYLIIGFIAPNTNALLHLYCYLAGLIFAFLNKPIKSRHCGGS